MSIRKNSISVLSSFNSFNRNISKISKPQYFSANNYYIRTKSRKISNKRGSIYMKRMESIGSNNFKSYNIQRKIKFSFSNLFKQKKIDQKKRFYNPEVKPNLKSILKTIKDLFLNKYNNRYKYDDTNIIDDNTNDYFLSDYYAINDLLNKKRFRLTILLKEYDILYNPQEILIKFYGKKERYIIMKYLLSFIYKYDELTFDKNKEIDDNEAKEELIKSFHYITSSQYLIEHLLDNDSFKGIKYLLKRINLSNKKAQYDYSYLEMTKSKIISEENKYIINAIKAVNEFMDNRKFIEKKLIKNIPFEKVPSCVPNYYPLGFEFNLSLTNYKKLKKYKKIRKPGYETIEMINQIVKENSKFEINKDHDDLIKQKNVLFNIDEKNTENESSIGDSENNYIREKQNKKMQNNYVFENNFNNLLPSSLYEKSENENIINKNDDLVINTKKENKINKNDDLEINQKKGNINGNKLIHNMLNSYKTETRLTRDPDIFDIQNFLYIFPEEKKERKIYNINYNKNSTNLIEYEKSKSKFYKEIKKVNNDNQNIKDIEKKNLFFKENIKALNDKSKQSEITKLKLKNSIKNSSKLEIEIINNSSKNNTLYLLKKKNEIENNMKTKKLSQNNNNSNLSLISYNLISNQKKSNKKFIKNNKIEPLLLSPSSNNNISSTIFSNINHLSRNLSSSQFLQNEKERNNLLNKNNSSIFKQNYNLNKYLSFENILNNKRANKKNGISRFKDTQDFIDGLKQYYNRISVKPNFVLKNLSSFPYNFSSVKKISKLNYSSKKSIKSTNILNSPKIKDKEKNLNNINGSESYIKNISKYIKKQFKKQKLKESKNISFNQIIKNSYIYSSELL